MTMKNYIDELINAIPTPETLQQEQLERIIKNITEALRNRGYYEANSFGIGTRVAEKNMVKRVAKIFEEKGYTVSNWFYADSNYKVFDFRISM